MGSVADGGNGGRLLLCQQIGGTAGENRLLRKGKAAFCPSQPGLLGCLKE